MRAAASVAVGQGAKGSGRLQLTARERDVMTLVAAGYKSGDLAERLFLSSETVKSHVHNAMVKLNTHTRAHAVAIALITGQIEWELDSGSSTPAVASGVQRPLK